MMTSILRLPTLALIAGLAGIAPLEATAQACLPSSAEASRLVAWVRADVANPVDIDSIGLEAVPPEQVVLVQDDSLCASARASFNGIIQPAWGVSPAEQVYVIRAGPNRYVVIDPRVRFGEWQFHAVFDTSWQLTGHYGG